MRTPDQHLHVVEPNKGNPREYINQWKSQLARTNGKWEFRGPLSPPFEHIINFEFEHPTRQSTATHLILSLGAFNRMKSRSATLTTFATVHRQNGGTINTTDSLRTTTLTYWPTTAMNQSQRVNIRQTRVFFRKGAMQKRALAKPR